MWWFVIVVPNLTETTGARMWKQIPREEYEREGTLNSEGKLGPDF